MKRVKVSIIGSVGIPAKYGGFETLTEYLTKEQNGNFEFSVYCSSKMYPNKLKSYNGAKICYIPLNANGIQSVIYDTVSIIDAIRKVDVLLVLGVPAGFFFPVVKLFSKKKIIVNIDGVEWRREKWGKFAKKFLHYSEKIAVKYADVVIADNKVIQDYVFKSYNINAKLIAYGGDHNVREALTKDTIEQFPFVISDYAFTVCRIEPENKIHIILDSFDRFDKLKIVLVGNWDNNDYARNLKRQYNNNNNIILLNPIYDLHKLNQLRGNCKVYIHGHSAGGTNPSLVEAMCLKLPIIAFNADYNIETTSNEALYFNDSEELINILSKVNSKELEKISDLMFQIAQGKYLWNIIANQYAVLFAS